MANEQNLRPCEHKLTEEEAKKGGIKSGETRRRKRDLREALEILLEKDFVDKKTGETAKGIDVITAALFKEASKGNVKAFNSLRDTIGQMPIQKVAVAEVNQDVINEVEDIVFSAENDK